MESCNSRNAIDLVLSREAKYITKTIKKEIGLPLQSPSVEKLMWEAMEFPHQMMNSKNKRNLTMQKVIGDFLFEVVLDERQVL